MKIVRMLSAISLALLAAVPALAAAAPSKPPAEDATDAGRDSWRGQAIGMCVAQLRDPERVTPNELETVCGCGVDRLMAGRPTATLPALTPDILRTEIGRPLLACLPELRPAVAVALARRLAEPQPIALPTADAKPIGTPAPAPYEAPKPSGFNLQSWFDGLSMPAWVANSGLPLWAWILLGFLGLALLRALFRGGGSDDLIGPPPSMRLGARHNLPEPRRADPPQRS